jgi:ankyrin repeat protein
MINLLFNNVGSSPKDFLLELFKKELDIKKLNQILGKKKFTINHLNEKGENFLHICISNDKYKSAKWLIENTSIDCNVKTSFGYTPIDIAIQKNNHFIVELIINSKKVNLNTKDKDGRTYLQNAIILGSNKAAKKILESPTIDLNSIDHSGQNVLFDAVSYGDTEIIDILLNNDKINLNQKNIHGQTILHKKEVLRDENLAYKLIEKGMDPTICDINGTNYLTHIATKGIEGAPLLKKIIQKGININARVRDNNTILMETMLAFYKTPLGETKRRESLLEMAETLTESGIDIQAINKFGENGIFEAIRNNDFKSVAFFINKRINLNIKNKKQQTPLKISALQGIKNLDITILLLKNGADPSIKNNEGKDVLEILNELILHLHNFKNLTNPKYNIYLNKEENKQYLVILKEILQNSQFNLENINSKKEPLFFEPILCGFYDLFKLYATNKFNLNETNIKNQNIFSLFVENSFLNSNYDNEAFKNILLGLLSYGIQLSIFDENNKNIFANLIQPNINIKMFEIFIENSRYKIDTIDSQGRTICHYAILNKHNHIVKYLFSKDNLAFNKADNLGILPLTYASLLQNFDVVKTILSNGQTVINSPKQIPIQVKEKFKPMVNNIDNLKNKTTDPDLLRKLGILVEQIKQDFKI